MGCVMLCIHSAGVLCPAPFLLRAHRPAFLCGFLSTGRSVAALVNVAVLSADLLVALPGSLGLRPQMRCLRLSRSIITFKAT